MHIYIIYFLRYFLHIFYKFIIYVFVYFSLLLSNLYMIRQVRGDSYNSYSSDEEESVIHEFPNRLI